MRRRRVGSDELLEIADRPARACSVQNLSQVGGRNSPGATVLWKRM